MAIQLNTPRGKGYSACCNGIPKECNPYYVRLLISGLQDFYESGEWIAGWNQAYNENKFGINLNDKTL